MDAHTLQVPAEEQDSCPTTPVNRNFPFNADPTFATAILSPSSNEVFAARTRARSRSDVFVGKTSIQAKQSPLAEARACAAQTPLHDSSLEHVGDDENNSSFERTRESIELSMGSLKLDTPNTSVETYSSNVGADNSYLAVDSRTPKKQVQDHTHVTRRKSYTISMPPIKTPGFQDVFGPNVSIQTDHHDKMDKAQIPAGPISEMSRATLQQPRRMTISAAPLSILKTGKSHESLRKRQSLRIIVEPITGRIQTPSPPSPLSSLQAPTSPVYVHSMPSIPSSPMCDLQTTSELTPQKKQLTSEEDNLNALQQLIQSVAKERPEHSGVLSEVTPVHKSSIGAVLEYRRSSPTSTPIKAVAPPCELCGAVALRLTMLEPCGHLACAACCSSGLNQVTATPPRAHVCASCHTRVEGISLHKGNETPRVKVDASLEGKYDKRQPQTPNLDEQRMLFARYKMSSSSPMHVRQHSSATKTSSVVLDKTDVSSHDTDYDEKVAPIEIADSSDAATEDESFFMSSPVAMRANQGRTMSLRYYDTVDEGPEEGETTVVRMDNIPWTVSNKDIIDWLPASAEDMLPDSNLVAQAVHIPVDVVTGKTANCCFVECRNKRQAMKLVRHRNNTRLLGRPVTLILTNHEDLLNEIFPFRVTSPRKEDEFCLFFTPGIMTQLLSLLKNGSTQLKSPAKVIDLATSMVCLVPSTLAQPLRDVLFDRIKDIICTCIMCSEELTGLHESLNRLVSASSCCSCFTVYQRIDILDSARQALHAISQHY